MLGLIPVMGSTAFTVAAFLVALSIIITVHEYGHYIVGRWSGIHAEVFSLGFGPVIWSRTDRRGTQWQVALVPLGGYVKFLGDGDAASATADEGFLEHIAHVEREKELRRTLMGAPLWARAATVAAGPVFNFVLAALIFAGVFFHQGMAVEPPTVGTLAEVPGNSGDLQPGDQILSIGGIETPDYEAIFNLSKQIDPVAWLDYQVMRGGEQTTVTGPWPFPALVSGLLPGQPAINAGMKVGDLVTAIDGQPVVGFSDLQRIVWSSEGREMVFSVLRDGETVEIAVTPRLSESQNADGSFQTHFLTGVSGGELAFDPATKTRGAVSALWRGIEEVGNTITGSLSMLKSIVTGEASHCNLRGVIGIAEASGDMAAQGPQSFIAFIALLSAAVGLLNLFPIPVLDGGHLVFHAWELVARKPPPEKVVRVMMGMGLLIIVALMAFALGNDLLCP